MKKILVTTLLVLTPMTMLAPLAMAQYRPVSTTLSAKKTSVTRLTKTQMRRKINSVPIRRRLTTEPPKPQPYWKRYITDSFVLDCWVNDDTNKIEYCDLYV